MKKYFLIFMVLLLFKFQLLAENKNLNNDAQVLKNQRDKISYSIGLKVGENLRNQTAFFKLEPLLMGISDSLSGKSKLLSDPEITKALEIHNKELRDKQMLIVKRNNEQNILEEKEFLNKNKLKKDIKTLASGLQYKIIKEGKGKTPQLNDAITVHYRAYFVNGVEFDNSYVRKQPSTLLVSSLIPGWKEAMLLMKVGSKWELFIPSNLAYGPIGNGSNIQPNKALIFSVELLAIEKTEK